MALTKNELDTLAAILMQHCEECDTSRDTGRKVNRIFAKVKAMNEGGAPC